MAERGGEAAPQASGALAALLAVTVLGVVVRLSGLDGEGFWYDELRTLLASRRDLVPMIGERLVAGHPPLFFGLSWLLVHLVGESELLLRLPAALAGTAAVPVAYLLASGRGARGVGLLGAGLVALSPAQLALSRVARPYAPLVLVALLSTALLVRVEDRPGEAQGRDVLLFGLLTLLALGLHASALLVLAGQLVFLAVRRRPRWRLVAAGLGALVLALAGLGAGLAVLDSLRIEPPDPLGWLPAFSWSSLVTFPRDLLFGVPLGSEAVLLRTIVLGLSAGTAALAFLAGWRGWSEPRTRALASLCAVPLAVGLAASAFGHDLLRVPRYFGVSGVALLLLAARGAWPAGKLAPGSGGLRSLGRWGGVVAALLLGASAAGCVLFFRFPRHPDWRAAAWVVQEHRGSGEEIAVASRFSTQEAVLEYYLGEEVVVFPSVRSSTVPPALPGWWIVVPSTPTTLFSDAPQESIERLADRYREREEHRVPGALLVHAWHRKSDFETADADARGPGARDPGGDLPVHEPAQTR